MRDEESPVGEMSVDLEKQRRRLDRRKKEDRRTSGRFGNLDRRLGCDRRLEMGGV